MIKIQNSKKKIISIGQYKVIDVILSDNDKDIFHVQDLKNPTKLYTLKILKSNQNPKQIDTEIEILNILNPYKETANFRKLKIFSDKLLFIFDYLKGDDLQTIYLKDKTFFNQTRIKEFVKSMLQFLEIYKQNNITHNNINPKNILYDGEKYYLIGLSKATISKNVDQKDDYYSIVSILYFLITGKVYEIELYIPDDMNADIFILFKNVLENKHGITKEEIEEKIYKV